MLIYQASENEQNAFKSSTTQMKLANEIAYKTCNWLLQKDLCHFDGNHKRTKSFVTLTDGAYHRLLRKQVVLGTMNCNYEDSSTVAKSKHFKKLILQVKSFLLESRQ